MQHSQVKPLGNLLLNSAAFFVLLFLLLRWVDSSVAQSLTLAVLVGIGYGAYNTVSARATANLPVGGVR